MDKDFERVLTDSRFTHLYREVIHGFGRNGVNKVQTLMVKSGLYHDDEAIREEVRRVATKQSHHSARVRKILIHVATQAATKLFIESRNK